MITITSQKTRSLVSFLTVLVTEQTGKYGVERYLVGGYQGYNRRFHLQETPLPGGDTAIRNPSRIALAYLFASGFEWSSWLPPVSQYQDDKLSTLYQQISQNINCPQTTSMGRLFDAVSSLVGIRHNVSYEGQAAIELENFCDPEEKESYEFPVSTRRDQYPASYC